MGSIDDEYDTAEGFGTVAAEPPDPDRSGLAAFGRLLDALRRVHGWAFRPTLRPWLLTIAAIGFVVLAVGSFRSLPEGGDPQPAFVAILVFVTAPATLVLNGLEYRFMASTLGHRLRLRHALRVSLVASVANYLPAPGGVAVRTGALRQRGSSIRSAVSINLVAASVWAGLTGIVAGSALLAAGEVPGRAALATLAGALLLAIGVFALRQGGSGWSGRVFRLAGIELATALLSGIRLWVALAAIGDASSFGAAIAVSSSVVLAALLGIFPAGLGIRELLAGGLAAAVQIEPVSAIAAIAVDRVAGQAGLALTALLSGVRWTEVRGTSGVEGSRTSPPVRS